MSVKKVFLTGATGYIGGDALYAIQEAQPDWEISVLVRDEEKFAKVREVFPKVNAVIGSLDDYDVLKDAAAKADIVIHTADSSDHAGAAHAIADGLASTHSPSNPAYYVHIGGTGILCWYDAKHERYGQAPVPEQTYDDLDGVNRIVNDIPDEAWHRDVDKIVLAEAARDPQSVKIAIVCPPAIYGVGRGPVNQRSRQVPYLIALTLQKRTALVLGDGLTEWNYINVHDLSQLIVLLAQQAITTPAAQPNGDGTQENIFGPHGYFFCESGAHSWNQVAELVAAEAHKQGLIEAPSTSRLEVDEARDKYPIDLLPWGLNSRSVARRAHKYLGWTPKSPSLQGALPEMVRFENERKKQGLDYK